MCGAYQRLHACIMYTSSLQAARHGTSKTCMQAVPGGRPWPPIEAGIAIYSQAAGMCVCACARGVVAQLRSTGAGGRAGGTAGACTSASARPSIFCTRGRGGARHDPRAGVGGGTVVVQGDADDAREDRGRGAGRQTQ